MNWLANVKHLMEKKDITLQGIAQTFSTTGVLRGKIYLPAQNCIITNRQKAVCQQENLMLLFLKR